MQWKHHPLLRTRSLLPLLVFLLVGGSSNASQQPNRKVVFQHADEIRRGDGFMVLADRRIFLVTAFLNATGYDEQPTGVPMHPVRELARKRLTEQLAKHPGKLKKWRAYAQNKQLASYTCMNFALSLEADYPFRRIRPDHELWHPQMAKHLRDFPDILRDFWNTAQLTNVWTECKPAYLAELNKYDLEEARKQMAFLWEYLRMPRRDTLTLVHVPNPLDQHYHAIGSAYENCYFCVEGPGSGGYGLNIHEYLHSIVNPLIKAAYAANAGKLRPYYDSGRSGRLSRSYQEPVTFTYECMIRALDHRIECRLQNNPALTAKVERTIAKLTADGLSLTKPFYEALSSFESSGKAFDEFLPSLLASVPAMTQASTAGK